MTAIAQCSQAAAAPMRRGAAHRVGRAWERMRRPSDALLGMKVVVWLSVAAVLLRLLPPRAALRVVAGRRRQGEVRWPEVERTAAMVDAWLSVWPFRMHGRCLRRSLVLCRLLRAAALEVTVELGVRRIGGRLSGHSWVAWRGRPLFERLDPEQDFATMARWS